MAKILKSAMVIGFISLLIYITVNTNQPIEGEKAIKHELMKEHEVNKIISCPLITKDGIPIPFNFICKGNVQYRVDMMNFARAMAREHLSSETEFFKTTLPSLIVKEYPLTTIIKETL